MNLEKLNKTIEYLCIGVMLLIPFFFPEIWAIIPLVGVIITNIIEARKESKTIQNFKRKFIEKQLKYLFNIGEFPDNSKARCTYHIIVDNKRFEQFVNYHPTNDGINREFPLNQGIIGHSYNRKICFVENFKNSEEYRIKMIQNYNFSKEEVQERRTDRRSYFCYPVLDGHNNIYGVVYFDASIYNLFKDLKCELVQNLINYLDMINNDIIEILTDY